MITIVGVCLASDLDSNSFHSRMFAPSAAMLISVPPLFRTRAHNTQRVYTIICMYGCTEKGDIVNDSRIFIDLMSMVMGSIPRDFLFSFNILFDFFFSSVFCLYRR